MAPISQGWTTRDRFPEAAMMRFFFFLHHRIQNGSGAHPASYPGDFALGVKRPGREADNSPPYSTEVKECVELYFHSPNTSSWRGAWQGTGTTSSSFYIYMK